MSLQKLQWQLLEEAADLALCPAVFIHFIYLKALNIYGIFLSCRLKEPTNIF